jgi:hypothetical protein
MASGEWLGVDVPSARTREVAGMASGEWLARLLGRLG